VSLNYDHSTGMIRCAKRHLAWDAEGAAAADKAAKKAGLTQAQFDAALDLYMDQVVRLFDPKTYPLIGRLALAFHFLFGKRIGA
jgi:hypothetical protein